MNEKPDVPIGKKKELCEKIYAFIVPEFRTKEQISWHIWSKPLNSTRDRQIRDMISVLKKHVPIVSPSSGEGYKVARGAQDLDLVIHQWRENDSRIGELKANSKPLIKFYEKYGGA